MNTNTKIKELQQQYFDFCTSLIKKIPFDTANPDTLLAKAFELRDALEKEIIQCEIESKHEAIKEIEKEITELKATIQNKG